MSSTAGWPHAAYVAGVGVGVSLGASLPSDTIVLVLTFACWTVAFLLMRYSS